MSDHFTTLWSKGLMIWFITWDMSYLVEGVKWIWWSVENLLVSWRHDLAWCHNVVVIATTWGSNPVRGVLEICDGENLWQWFRLEIRRKRLSWVNHSAKTIHHWRRGGGIFPGGGMRKFSASGGNCFSITTFLRS